MNYSIIVLWGFFISFVIRLVYQVGHLFILPSVDFPASVKILIFIATGAISPLILVWLRKRKIFDWLLNKINNKSINDDVWDVILDYNDPPMPKVYVKGADILYIGRFAAREENGLNSWIVITDYIRANKENKLQYNPEEHNQKSMIALNMRDIERVELVYSQDSKIWKKYNLP